MKTTVLLVDYERNETLAEYATENSVMPVTGDLMMVVESGKFEEAKKYEVVGRRFDVWMPTDYLAQGGIAHTTVLIMVKKLN